MRILLIALLGTCWLALPIAAQSTIQQSANQSISHDADKQYYLLIGPTWVKQEFGRARSLALAVGVEQLLGEHVVMGGEIAESIISNSLRNPQTNKLKEHAGHVLWIALNGGYLFRRSDDPRPFKPFLTAGCGISGVQDAGLGTQINYGAGFNRWYTAHLGVRVEVRRFIHSGESEKRFMTLRVGLGIR
jgi:hypothetical protein